MLERKVIPYRRIDLLRGAHPFLVRRVLRFPGDTVPALRLNGTKLQQTRTISRTLDLVPSGSEQAEQWAEHAMSQIKHDLWWWAISRRFRRVSQPTSLDAIPDMIDRVDALLAEGVVGRGEPNSADLHAAVLVRLIWCLRELRGRLGDRPALALADRFCRPERYPGRLAVLL